MKSEWGRGVNRERRLAESDVKVQANFKFLRLGMNYFSQSTLTTPTTRTNFHVFPSRQFAECHLRIRTIHVEH